MAVDINAKTLNAGFRGDMPLLNWMERYGTGEPIIVDRGEVHWVGVLYAMWCAVSFAAASTLLVVVFGFDAGWASILFFMFIFTDLAAYVAGTVVASGAILDRNGYGPIATVPDDWWYSLPVRPLRQYGSMISHVGGRLWFCTASSPMTPTQWTIEKWVPWEAVAAFEVTTHSRYFRTHAGWPKLQDWFVIVAHVQGGRVLMVANDARRTQAEMAELHADLTYEFIGRRGPILQNEEALRLGVLSAVSQATRPNGM